MCLSRYPTNKWQKLGTFHARDERTVQSFPLDEHLYAKYVKVSTAGLRRPVFTGFGPLALRSSQHKALVVFYSKQRTALLSCFDCMCVSL